MALRHDGGHEGLVARISSTVCVFSGICCVGGNGKQCWIPWGVAEGGTIWAQSDGGEAVLHGGLVSMPQGGRRPAARWWQWVSSAAAHSNHREDRKVCWRIIIREPLSERRYVCEVCLLKEQRHRPLQNQTRGSRLGSLYYDNKN